MEYIESAGADWRPKNPPIDEQLSATPAEASKSRCGMAATDRVESRRREASDQLNDYRRER